MSDDLVALATVFQHVKDAQQKELSRRKVVSTIHHGGVVEITCNDGYTVLWPLSVYEAWLKEKHNK